MAQHVKANDVSQAVMYRYPPVFEASPYRKRQAGENDGEEEEEEQKYNFMFKLHLPPPQPGKALQE
jgi:hypothetical protein